MSSAGQPLSAEQNAKITTWVVKKRIKQMIGSARSFLELRRRVRLTRAEARWRYSGRVAGILGGSVMRHLKIAREQIMERKRKEGAQAMQSFFRGTYTRSKYLKRISKVQKATTIIWTSYRRWQERIELQRWLDVKVEETRKRKEEERKKREEEERQRKMEEERLRREEERRLATLKEEERKAEEAAKLEEARRKREEERKAREEQERLEAEKKEKERLEQERIKMEQEEKERAEEKKRKEEQEKKEAEEAERRLQQEKEEQMRRQQSKSIKLQEEREHEREAEHERKRERRKKKGRKHKEMREKEERQRREEEDERIMRERFPEQYDRYSDEDSNSDDSRTSDEEEEDDAPSLQEQLRNFSKIAATGQLFLKYTGKRRRKPQDRIVKVSFDNKYRPKQISWGSGSRHIDFSEILYIAWGHYTPVFEARKDQLKKDLCFSVVGKQQILDVQAQSKEMAELWVKGLRKLIGMSDEESDRRAKEGLESGNLPGHNRNKDVSESKRAEREHKKRTKSLMLLQQDLFVMTTTTVFRNLEEERIWDIDQGVRERFNAKSLYELALREDIPWRQWNHWVREKIVTYLRDHNRIQHPQQVQYPYPTPQQVGYQNNPYQNYPYPNNPQPNYPYPTPQQHYPEQPRVSGVMPMNANMNMNPNMANTMPSPNMNPNMAANAQMAGPGPGPGPGPAGPAGPQGGGDKQTDENCSLM